MRNDLFIMSALIFMWSKRNKKKKKTEYSKRNVLIGNKRYHLIDKNPFCKMQNLHTTKAIHAHTRLYRFEKNNDEDRTDNFHVEFLRKFCYTLLYLCHTSLVMYRNCASLCICLRMILKWILNCEKGLSF